MQLFLTVFYAFTIPRIQKLKFISIYLITVIYFNYSISKPTFRKNIIFKILNTLYYTLLYALQNPIFQFFHIT